MIKVGLTGGIGAGKTTASDRFEDLGVPVIDTDLIAREITAPGSKALADIVAAFGGNVLRADGELDREQLGRIVFSDNSKRRKLEAILHPIIRKEVVDRMAELSAPYCVVVVPLLIETDFTKLIDKVLVIDAPEGDRVQWLKHRSGLTETEAKRIFEAQTSRVRRLAAADYTIVNNGTVEEFEDKVTEFHNRLLAEIASAEE